MESSTVDTVNPTVADIKRYLEMMVSVRKSIPRSKPTTFRFLGIEDMLLQYGREWTPGVLPKGIGVGTPKECFSNAHMVALRNPHLTYVEGYFCGVIPTLHAWCVTDDGTVVDPTVGRNRKDGIIGRDVSHKTGGGSRTIVRVQAHAYFGIPLDLKYVNQTLCDKGTYGILENWEQEFPLLTGKVKIEDVISPKFNTATVG